MGKHIVINSETCGGDFAAQSKTMETCTITMVKYILQNLQWALSIKYYTLMQTLYLHYGHFKSAFFLFNGCRDLKGRHKIKALDSFNPQWTKFSPTSKELNTIKVQTLSEGGDNYLGQMPILFGDIDVQTTAFPSCGQSHPQPQYPFVLLALLVTGRYLACILLSCPMNSDFIAIITIVKIN